MHVPDTLPFQFITTEILSPFPTLRPAIINIKYGLRKGGKPYLKLSFPTYYLTFLLLRLFSSLPQSLMESPKWNPSGVLHEQFSFGISHQQLALLLAQVAHDS